MIRFLFFALFAFSAALDLPAAHAADAPTSLFFSDAECAAIEAMQKALPLDQAERRDSVLTLNAVLYSAPRDWVVWINGKRFTPDTPARGFTIERVTPSTVLLRRDAGAVTLTLGSGKGMRFDAEGEETEGKAR